jgi:hypothetical protein
MKVLNVLLKNSTAVISSELVDFDAEGIGEIISPEIYAEICTLPNFFAVKEESKEEDDKKDGEEGKKAEEPKVEEPKVEDKKVEEPKVEDKKDDKKEDKTSSKK